MHMLTLIQRKPLSILISDKADFRGKNINERGKNFILIMESTIQENIAILSVYAPNYKIWIKMKQTLMVLQEKKIVNP